MKTGELEVVGYEPVTEEDLALVAKSSKPKKKEMVHISEIIVLGKKD
jgi:hypothetical protein